jgi:23S rRNA pseudouridine955/2504/2580 synthase
LKRVTVLYEDAECAVFNKPAGLAVQGGERVGASLDAILAEEWGGPPFLVHRLDKETSGVILVAKNRDAAARFSRLIADRAAVKRYLAICAGSAPDASGVIDAGLCVKGRDQPALTRYRLLASNARFSLLELELETGRMHQIRRHLAQITHPVLGDDKYGDFALNRRLRAERALRRLLLHAAHLALPLAPGRLIAVSAPPPDYFTAFMEAENMKPGDC